MIYIDDYPFDERYKACDDYQNQIDWNRASAAIQIDGIAWFDVSTAIGVFPNLVLDENYRLFCCMTREYHGFWGRVAAMHRDDPELPKLEESILPGYSFALPPNAAPPMQAVYRTDHPHGYLDAILCQRLLCDIPYAGNVHSKRKEIIDKAPSDFQSGWDVFLDIADWPPRIIRDSDGFRSIACGKLLLFHRVFENGLGSSDGLDSLYLDEYRFYSSPGIYGMVHRNNVNSMYHGFINGNDRYSSDRRCCVFECSSIEVAKQYSESQIGT